MRRLAGILVRMFPDEFRARYGAELGDVLVRQARDVRRRYGWWAASRTLLFQGTDLLLSARAERRQGSSLANAAGPAGASGASGGPGPALPGPPPDPDTHGFGRWLAALVSDIRFGARSLCRSPGFLIAGGFTLALGIGAATAIFTVINGVLLSPLAYPEPDALVAVWLHSERLGYDRINHTTSSYLTFRDHSDSFEELGTFWPGTATITGSGEPELVEGMEVTDGALRALGARAVVGRLYGPEDVAPGAPPRAILGYGFWQRRFGGDPAIVGDTIEYDGTSVEVIGVLTAGFRFLDYQPAVYAPIRLDPAAAPSVLSFDYRVIGRLSAGVTLDQAAAELTGLIPASVERYGWLTPEQSEEWSLGARVQPLRDAIVGGIGPQLWILFGSVGIVLLVACANVANLFLVRAEARRREIAVRTALGASRRGLLRQFMSESVLLGLVGGIGGLLVAYAGVPALLRMAPESLPRAADVGVDPVVLAFCFALSFAAGLVFGVFPGLQHRAAELVPALKGGARDGGAGRRGKRVRALLGVAEVALALVLLVGAGLMVRSYVALWSVDPGLRDPQEVLTFGLSLTRGDYPDEDQAILAYESILESIAAIPGVANAGATSGLTMGFASNSNSFIAEGVPPEQSGGVLNGFYKAVAGDYFDAAGIPLVAGRTFTWTDVRDRRPVGLVTERVAEHFWGTAQEALGKRIRHSGDDPWREIIGVVGDVRDRGLRSEPTPVAFWPVVVQDFLGFDSWLRRNMTFVVRVEGAGPLALLPRVRDAVWQVDPDLPVAAIDTLDSVITRYLARTSFALTMLMLAAAVATVLGTIGIYGVIAYAFAKRRREIGIRMALGASNGAIRSLVLRQGVLVGGAGVVLGLAGALALTRFLSSMVYDVGTLDPLTYAAASLFAGAVALLASYLPALRATTVDPVEALRR